MKYALALALSLFAELAQAQCTNGQCGVPSRWSFGRTYSQPAYTYQQPAYSYYQPQYTYEQPVVYSQPQVIYSQPVQQPALRTRTIVWVPVMVR